MMSALKIMNIHIFIIYKQGYLNFSGTTVFALALLYEEIFLIQTKVLILLVPLHIKYSFSLTQNLYRIHLNEERNLKNPT